MDALLKNAQQAVAPIATPIENLIGGAVHAVQQAFTPAPISPVPQQQTMPQAQPNSIQSLLSTLPQETMGALNMAGQMLSQGAQQGEKTVGDIMNQAQQFQKGFQGAYNQGIGSPSNPFTPKPQVDFTSGINTGNPVLDMGLKAAAGIPESVLNSPADIQKGTGQTMSDIASGAITRPQTALSDVASVASPLLNLALLPAGGGVAKEGLEQGLLQGLKEGAVTGAKYGGGFGLLSGLQSGKDINNPMQYAGNLALNTAGGAGAGAVLGGGLGVVGGIGKNTQDAFNALLPKQISEDVKNPELLSQPTVAGYRSAFTALQDKNTEKELTDAVGKLSAGQLDDKLANDTVQRATQEFLPQYSIQPQPVQARVWDYLIARKNGSHLNEVPPEVQGLDQTILHFSGNQILQSGKINLGAEVKPEAPVANAGLYDTGKMEAGQIAQGNGQAVNEDRTSPIKGSDISVKPQAQIKAEIRNPEPLPWETNGASSAELKPTGGKTTTELLGKGELSQAQAEARLGLPPKELGGSSSGTSISDLVNNRKSEPLGETKNKVNLTPQGATEKEKVQSAIVNSERVKNSIAVRGKDAYVAGTKLSPHDIKLAEQYEHGVNIDDLAKQADNPQQFTKFMGKLTDYYDYRLATDRAVGGQTPLRQNYLRHIWDLSNPQDLERFNEIATQRGLQPWNGFKAQPRVFDTYAQGEAAGFKRVNPNILGDLQQDYKGASRSLSTQALKQGLVQAAPDKVSAQGLGYTPEGKPFVNSNIPGLEGMSFHPTVNDMLKGFQPSTSKDLFTAIKEKGFTQGIKDTGVVNSVGSLYDHVTQPMKHFLLNFSGFHSINISSNYAGAEIFNPGKAIKGLGQSIPSFFSENLTQKVIDGFKSKIIDGRDYSVFEAGLRSGVNMDRGLPAQGLSRLNPFNQMSKALFDRELYTLKLNLVDQVFGNGKIDPESPQGHAVGQEINLIIGEMNNRTMNINPNTQKWLSRLMLAPQFTESKYKMIADSVLKGGPQGSLARQTVIGKSVVLGTLSTLGTLLMTGKFPNLQQLLTNYTTSPTIQTNLTNPKGHLQDIGLPQSFISEPLAPIAGLLGGSTDALTHYGEARLNPGISNFLKVYSNKDYYGNPIVDSTSKTPVTSQLFQNLGLGMLPIGVQNVAKLMQGTETPAQAGINIAGLRTMTSPNDPQSIYFKNLQKVQSGLNAQQVTAFNYLRTSGAKGGLTQAGDAGILLKNWDSLYPALKQTDVGEQVHNPILSQPEAQAKAYYTYLTMNPQQQAEYVQNHPEMLDNVKSMQQYWSQTAVASGKQPYAQNPLYSFPNKTIANYMEYEVQNKTAPGGPDEKAFLKAHPDVLPVIQAISQYYAQNPVTTQSPISAMMPAMTMAYPQASSYVQQQLNNKNYNDPQVQSYLTNHLDYVNQERANSGLAPINSYGAIQGAGGAGAASLSSSTVSFLRRAIGKNERYNSKAAFQKVSQAFGRAGQPTVRYYTQHPKFATRPIGNKRSMGGMLAKGGKGYSSKKGRTTSSLMASAKRPRYKTLPIPKTGKPKNVFLMG